MSKLFRINDVIVKTGMAKSTIWAWVQNNRFPKPLKISNRITVWKESDIDEWIEKVCNENQLQKTKTRTKS